jgi:GAF domain-containing protein
VQTVDYDLLVRQVSGLLQDERDFIANAANFAAFTYIELPSVNWAGFYLPASDGLVLGPFGGKPACTRLPQGQGVCNRAFSEMRTVVVDDVSAVADHIYCDSASRSEMVVPLIVNGVARGVFDLDSPELARFRPEDQTGIERLVACFLEATSM